MSMPIVWIIVAAILFIGEMACPIFFMFWFALGALAATLTAFITGNITIQASVFVIVSAILLIFMKPLTNKLKTKTKDELNTNSVIGKHAIVEEEINTLTGTGKVKVRGEIWKAVPNSDEVVIPKGAEVVVEKIDGVKLNVKVINNKE